MFSRWGDLVHRSRFTVLGVMVAFLLGLAAYGASLNDHLSQSGWDDPGSESVHAARTADGTFGRDSSGDVVALYTAPAGSTVDDPDFTRTIADAQNAMVAEHPDKIAKINVSYFQQRLPALASPDKTKAIATFAIVGDNDTELTNNFRDVKDAFEIPGVDVQLAGLQPIAGALNDTMAGDIKRMELLAIPVVGVLLFFVFGGVVAAALPLVIGGLTVVAANGMVRFFTNFVPVNSFVAPVVSLIGLGLAIDYALFIVSRFREELADGRTTGQAVQRSVMTAGRTVVFSATMIVASLGGLLLFPQGFLKSVAFGAISTVALAALTAITILPAMLSVLGKRIDMLGLKSMRKTKTTEEIESGRWGRLTRWVMRNPIKVTVPIVLGLLLITLPVGSIKFGGINETYLPPDNPTRVAQNVFDENFPSYRTEPLKIVLENAEGPQLGAVLREASNAPGLVERFSIERNENGVAVLKAGLVDRNVSSPAIDYIRSIDIPDGVRLSVGGTPAIEQDSIAALIDRLPLMATLVVLVTTLLMFLTFGSLVLPLKAILMTTLGLGATLGFLTFIFVDGVGAELLNFTPGPIMAPVLVLIIAIIFGLSTDYEVFLLSRMVEARARGASTSEAIRVGTSHTGRIITAAALILIVVTGAFAFSDLVMMKYIAYGMIFALIVDATLIRMFLVPATMKLLGDDCWWAPQWMKRLQEKMGLGEPILDDDRMPADVPEVVAIGSAPPPARVREPIRAREPLTQPIPRTVAPPARPEPARAGQDRPSQDRAVQDRAVQDRAVQDQTMADRPKPARVEPTRPAPARADQADADSPGADAAPRPETPRPIESWLAELRSPAVERRTPARPEPSARSDHATGVNGSNGSGSNGSGSNGSASTGTASNGSASSGSSQGSGSNGSNGSRRSPDSASGSTTPRRDTDDIDAWIADLRLGRPETPATPPAEAPRTRDRRPAPDDTDRPEGSSYDEPTPTESSPNEVTSEPANSEPTASTGGRRRAREDDNGGRRATESESGGRHHGQSGAISVSELLARQRRQ
ncbi:putative drug exporter of the RND superfamily [Rhodococcoides kroppenstedtii]|uniref:Putative drug exporter of the RND superfamily n=1 Tax=Rhodococcoides kroppenstedtii TaxID=293050 RepID=A0A1I0T6X4_9NOCA|nr:MMPL family transporter [Rhodococcus kroppenstedtii]SFA46776.1 putative drug exporter of the RND superfamily [Rhodococcus kroppenstedtii]